MLTGKKIEVLIDRSNSVSTLKEKIQEADGIPPGLQNLGPMGEHWENWRAIFDYQIEDNTVFLGLVWTLHRPLPSSPLQAEVTYLILPIKMHSLPAI